MDCMMLKVLYASSHLMSQSAWLSLSSYTISPNSSAWLTSIHLYLPVSLLLPLFPQIAQRLSASISISVFLRDGGLLEGHLGLAHQWVPHNRDPYTCTEGGEARMSAQGITNRPGQQGCLSLQPELPISLYCPREPQMPPGKPLLPHCSPVPPTTGL